MSRSLASPFVSLPSWRTKPFELLHLTTDKKWGQIQQQGLVRSEENGGPNLSQHRSALATSFLHNAVFFFERENFKEIVKTRSPLIALSRYGEFRIVSVFDYFIRRALARSHREHESNRPSALIGISLPPCGCYVPVGARTFVYSLTNDASVSGGDLSLEGRLDRYYRSFVPTDALSQEAFQREPLEFLVAQNIAPEFLKRTGSISISAAERLYEQNPETAATAIAEQLEFA